MAFDTLGRERAEALCVGPDIFFVTRRVQFATLAARTAHGNARFVTFKQAMRPAEMSARARPSNLDNFRNDLNRPLEISQTSHSTRKTGACPLRGVAQADGVRTAGKLLRFLVALLPVPELLLCAKHLFVAAMHAALTLIPRIQSTGQRPDARALRDLLW